MMGYRTSTTAAPPDVCTLDNRVLTKEEEEEERGGGGGGGAIEARHPLMQLLYASPFPAALSLTELQ